MSIRAGTAPREVESELLIYYSCRKNEASWECGSHAPQAPQDGLRGTSQSVARWHAG
jgi:hypothetical protein